MALFKPYKIQSSQLNSLPITEGQLIVTTDDKAMYLDISGSSRIKIYADDIAKIDELEGLEFVVVEELPTGSDIDPHKVYLIANGGTDTGGITYTLTKTNHMITLTGSDGSTSSVTDEVGITLNDLAIVATSGSYNDLSNKPQIGGVTLSGNKTLAQLGINIPDSTSDLTNDSGFITGITSSDVTTALGYTPYNATNPNGYISSYTETDPVFKASAAYGIKSTDITNWNNKTSNTGTITEIKVNNTSIATSGAANITVPTNNNQLTNGAGYQTASQVNSLIATAIGDITGISYEVVNSLPATGEAGVIYLISNSGTSPNIYDEYIYVNNNFEKIGTTEVDLSNYSTTTQVQSMIQTAIGDALEASY